MVIAKKKEDDFLMAYNNLNIVLKTTNLAIGYKTKKKDTVVASSINIELHKGELIGLVGANGIGKSTLLKTLTKVQLPLSGDVIIQSKNLNSFNAKDLAKVLGLVLTETITSKNLSVFELIALGRQPYTNWVGHLTEYDISIINNAMSQNNLNHLKHKKCYELSDGQLQKVLIARALAQDTSLIILDEPTTHLDMHHKASILKLLRTLAKETEKTILFSSHEIDLAIQLCDTLIVMTPNGIISGTPKKLIRAGVFNRLFPKNLIVFDEDTERFIINK